MQVRRAWVRRCCKTENQLCMQAGSLRETNYAQIEKELLAIVLGVQRFHQHTYGRKVVVDADHKPLETIFGKSLATAPRRLQKMFMRLQSYNLDIRYKKGSEMYLADTLSISSKSDLTTCTSSPLKCLP